MKVLSRHYLKFVAFLFITQVSAASTFTFPQASLVRSKVETALHLPQPALAESTEMLDVADISVGLGYMLCDQSSTPPPALEEAISSCDALSPQLKNISIPLSPVKTSDPSWKMSSGSYKAYGKFQGIKVTAEILVSFAIGNGKKYVFIEGRVGNDANAKKTYFQSTTKEAFSNLSSTSYYGFPENVVSGEHHWEMIPWFMVGPTL